MRRTPMIQMSGIELVRRFVVLRCKKEAQSRHALSPAVKV
jgi:hypothetical protein